MRPQAALILLGLLASQPICTAEEGPPASLMSAGIVDDGGMDPREIWFTLSQIDQRFVLDTAAVPDPRAFFDALKDSSSTGRSVHVSFDPASGAFLDGGDVPSYVVRSIEYDGRNHAGMAGPRRKNVAVPAAEAALARGVALYSGGLQKLALPDLDRALTGAELRPSLRALALETRGNAITESIWEERQQLTDDDDRLFVQALDDFRGWAALEPDSMAAQNAIGYVLRDLGAYEEAIELFRAIDTRWPEQRIRSMTRIGATYRMMGDYQRALAVLDELVAREGPQEGMMFHYHRGWTLNLLGRYDEAIAEFTEGLKTQPDYPSAFDRRACAHAMLGRLPEALADRRRADAEMSPFWNRDQLTPAARHDRAWAEGVVKALEAAIASGSTDPVAAACEGSWDYGEKRRERSRHLPPPRPVA